MVVKMKTKVKRHCFKLMKMIVGTFVFFDGGMINFMIPTDALAIRDFEKVGLKLQSL